MRITKEWKRYYFPDFNHFLSVLSPGEKHATVHAIGEAWLPPAVHIADYYEFVICGQSVNY